MTTKQLRNYGYVLLALVVVVLLIERPFGGGGSDSNDEPLYPDFEAEAVDRITVDNKGTVIDLRKRQAGDWIIEREFPLPADTAFIHPALKAVGEFSTSSPVSNNPEKHAVFEVDDESGADVSLYTGGEEPAFSFVLGKNAPNGATYYRPAGAEEVYLSQGAVKSYFVKNENAWRDRRIYNTDPAELVKLRIERGDSTIVFESDAEMKWYLRAPEEFEVKRESVDTMLRTLARLTANGMPDTLVAAEKLGFDEPTVKVRAETLDGRALELLIGNQTESGLYYAKRADREWVYLLAKYRVDPYYADLEAMRAPAAAPPDTTATAAGDS